MGRRWQTLYFAFAALCAALLALLVISSFPSRSATVDRFRADQIGLLLLNPLLLAYTLGIFFYVGAEVGTASWIVKFFDSVHGLAPNAAASTSTSFFGKFFPTLPSLIVALFWGAQGGGRLISGTVLHRFGSRGMLRTYAFFALASLLLANFGSTDVTAVAFVACGFFTSVLFTLVFSGTISSFTENHGTISGLLCTAIVGGALIPPMVGWLGDHWGMHVAMLLPAACFAYVFLLSVFGRARYEESHA
jgi:fucose permease